MTEAQFQRAVLDMVQLYGWHAYHTHDSRRSHPGWPDLVLCRPPRLLFVELKSEKGRVSPAQVQWLKELEACGMEVGIWRPDCLPRISRYLKRGVAERLPSLG